MIFAYFTLFVALVISAVAEFYSIVGLTAIFAAEPIPVIIMGVALGVGKITAAVWLKLNWDRASWTYKLYLVPAVAFLMVLTSMGIFGFLSKAHSDQSLVGGDVQAKIAVYDEKIKTARENIDANRKVLKQLDEAVDQSMARSTSETGADKAVAIRRGQAKERARLQNEIAAEQKTINQLSEARAPIAAEVRKVEAEVGPIKYIAAVIYGDDPDTNLLEKAVRFVIILIVAVFDPLALVLILAAQQSLRWAKETPEKDDQGISAETTNVPQDELPPAPPAAVVEPDAIEASQPEPKDPHPVGWMFNEPAPAVPEKTLLEQHPYLNQPFVHFKNLKPMVYKPEVEIKPPAEPVTVSDIIYSSSPDELQKEWTEDDKNRMIDKMTALLGSAAATQEQEQQLKQTVATGTYEPDDGPLTDDQLNQIRNSVAETYEPPPKARIVVPEARDPKPKNKPVTVDTAPTADNQVSLPNEVKAHFGITFPDTPDKGEMFLRVDYLPSRLFKFNGSKWIQVDKSLTDSYVYNEEYIRFLATEVTEGRVDADELSDSERDQLIDFLGNNEQSGNTP
jgi:hypothetical protein